jgi:hypothetical protein
MAQAGDVVVHATTVDITHMTGTEPVDQIDMTATFTNNELRETGRCENNTDSLIFHGVKVTVQPGLCGTTARKSNMTIPFFRPLSSTLVRALDWGDVESKGADQEYVKASVTLRLQTNDKKTAPSCLILHN